MIDLVELGKKAKLASKEICNITDEKINSVLISCANLLIQNKEYIKEQNAIDIKNANEKGISSAFIDRLTLSDKVISDMADGLKKIANSNSPVGKSVYSHFNKEQDIQIEKRTVPFGVVGIIYESRPNVTSDAFGLCLKSGNCVVLKGGSDSLVSNKAVVSILKQGLLQNGVTSDAVILIEDTSRDTTLNFMKLDKYIDLLIPRGGAKLIASAVQNSTIPIIKTGTGNCHIYIDEFADPDMAVNIVFNAKTQRYSVCNACESLVVHSKIANNILPKIANKLIEKQIEMRCDDSSLEILKDYPYLKKAFDEDFYEEYCAPIISVKIVDTLSDAITHINEHSTGHSESIITNSSENAEIFLNNIDSSTVYHNASTRFSDGEIFGLGAEVGISTQKLHARGPMGTEALVTTKYFVKGNGSIRK